VNRKACSNTQVRLAPTHFCVHPVYTQEAPLTRVFKSGNSLAVRIPKTPVTLYLKDYALPVWLIDTVDLRPSRRGHQQTPGHEPQVASHIARSFGRWRQFDAGRQVHTRAAPDGLAKDVARWRESVERLDRKGGALPMQGDDAGFVGPLSIRPVR